MLRLVAGALTAALIAHGAAHGADASSFRVGQKWSIKSSGIQIVIGHIDPFPGGGTAVSISVFNVPCPPRFGCTAITLAHTPFDSVALAKSVDKLLGEHAATDSLFEEGYAKWRQAKGGIYTIPVSQVPKLTFATLQHGHVK